MSGADVAGLWSALARHATSPEVKAAARRSAAVVRAASAMRAGRTYYTRSLPQARYVNPVWREQVRCERGHFVRADRGCRVCRPGWGQVVEDEAVA